MKRFLKSPWIISIASTLLGFILTVVYDLIKEQQILTTVGNIFSTLWNWIIDVLTFKLKVWWVLLGIASLLTFLFIMYKISELKEPTRPEYTNYTQDHFRTWKWSWKWEWNNYEKEWNIVRLQAHCPKCNTPMTPGLYEDYYQCPRCHYQSVYDNHDKSYEVKVVIIDNISRHSEMHKIEA